LQAPDGAQAEIVCLRAAVPALSAAAADKGDAGSQASNLSAESMGAWSLDASPIGADAADSTRVALAEIDRVERRVDEAIAAERHRCAALAAQLDDLAIVRAAPGGG
jgi:hypothetical protein